MLRLRPAVLLLLSFPLASCGARSPLFDGASSSSGAPSTPSTSSTDRCPSALQPGAPLPIPGNCSTRDGRARVAGPRSPHVTWTITLPPDPDPQSGYFIAGFAADASGAAYVVLGPNFGADVASLLRIDGATGALDWNTTYTPSSLGDALPVLPSSGIPQLIASTSQIDPAIDRFDPATGALNASTLSSGPGEADLSAAVGADGALYFAYTANAGSAEARSVVSRLRPDGTPVWTSVDLGTLGPPPDSGNDVFPTRITLGAGDLVLLGTSVITKPFDGAVIIALDPATGAARWANSLKGELLGGPTVAPDGSIVILINPPIPNLVVFEPNGATRRTVSVGQEAGEIYAIGADGTVVVGTSNTQGIDGLLAVTPSGKVAWTASIADVRSVTIDANGTVITSMAGGLEGLDLATGAVRWTLAAPHPSSCVTGFTLTSASSLVAAQCDDTVFGAGD